MWNIPLSLVGAMAGALLALPSAYFPSIVAVGDINADAVSDFVVIGYDSLSGVWMLDGRSGETLGRVQRKDGARGVASLGDQDGDGVPDFAVLYSADGEGNGAIDLVSGATRETIDSIPVPSQRVAVGMVGIGPLDEPATAIALATFQLVRPGMPIRLSFRSFSEDSWQHPGELGELGADRRRFATISRVGDLDRDGWGDLVVGFVPFGGHRSAALAVSAKKRQAIYPIAPPNYPGRDLGYPNFPCSVIATPDRDEDGVTDFLALALDQAAFLLSGRTGKVLLSAGSLSSQDLGQGATATLVDDCNGDAVPDLAVGSMEPIGCDGAEVALLSGATLETLLALKLREILGQMTCECKGGSAGADVAGLQWEEERVLALASMSCGTVGVFRASREGLIPIWIRQLSSD